MQKNVYSLFEKIGNLGEINIVLNILRSGSYECWALKKTISRSCGNTTKILRPDTLIDILFILGFLNLKKTRSKEIISLSELGNSFVDLEYNPTDRLTEKQGTFLLINAFGQTPLAEDLHLAISKLNKDPLGNLWISIKDKRIAIEEKLEIILRLLQQLKIAVYQDERIVIRQEEVDWIIEAISWSVSLDEETFEAILAQKRKVGEMAEEFVRIAEKNRLIKLGRRDLAEAIKIISKTNVSAGYDIESFDGDRHTTSPDRFIEVKGSLGGKIIFYITRNELNVAKKKGNTYWLYCVVNAASQESRKIYSIRNPVKSIFGQGQLKAEPMLWKCFM